MTAQLAWVQGNENERLMGQHAWPLAHSPCASWQVLTMQALLP